MKIFLISLILGASIPTFACDTSKFCEGDRVIFKNDAVGTILDFSTDGRARVTGLSLVSGIYQYFEISDFAGKGVQCFKGICEHDRVTVKSCSDHDGRVREVFTNGRVRVITYTCLLFLNIEDL